MKILYIANIPSPYVVSFLNELGKYAEVFAVFERSTSRERDESWSVFSADHFSYSIMSGVKYSVDKAFCPEVSRYLKKYKNDRIIIANPITATGMLAISWLKRNHVPYALRVDGGIPKDGKGFKEKFKRFLFCGAAHYYSSGELTDKYLQFYGAEIAKISRYPFTSVHQADVLSEPVSQQEKKQIRAELGLKELFTVIAVGQFIPRKGIDVMLRALGECDKPIQAVIIGGTPTEEYLLLCAEFQLNNVVFLPFMPKEKVLEYMRASDVFIMPTRYDIWGLVVNEAMSQGLPVTSSDACVAGIEMISPGKNGFIFPSENEKSLAAAISKIKNEEDIQGKMSMEAIETAKRYTYEKMAESFLNEWN